MTTSRSSLRSALSEELLPALRALGFAGPSAISGNSLLHDFKRSRNVLTLQLEKHGLPRFIVILANEPAEGFEAVIQRGGTVRQGQLKPRRGASTRSWFRADPGLWQRVFGASAANASAAVGLCASLLPEVEAWWQTELESQHITVHEVKFPGQQRAVA